MSFTKLLTYSILYFLFGCSGTTNTSKPFGLFPIKEYGKWGFINSSGEKVIKCQFDGAGQFSEGLAAVRVGDLFGFIDTTGKIVIKPQCQEVLEFSEGLCNVFTFKDTTVQTSFINREGKVVFTVDNMQYEKFNSGRCLVEINKKMCFINKQGKVVLNTGLPRGGATEYREGIAKLIDGKNSHWEDVADGGKKWTGTLSHYIDTAGNLMFTTEDDGGYNYFSEGLAFIWINDTVNCVDKKGRTKFKINEDLTLFDFSEGYVRATIAGRNHRSGFIDTNGKIVIPIIYPAVNHFKEGLAAFMDTTTYLWGFLDKTGAVAIKPQFEEMSEGFNNGLCYAKKDHQWGYIDHQGEFVWKDQTGFEYFKADLSKWQLDTLSVKKPMPAEKDAGHNNPPRKKTFDDLDQLTLKIDTRDLTVYQDKYFAYKLYLINASKDTAVIRLQDGRIRIIQQARNDKGEWQDIENYRQSFCGNSNHKIYMAPGEYQIFATPVFKGSFKTELRFKFEFQNKEIYSDSYVGEINQEQFLEERKKDKTTTVVWTN